MIQHGNALARSDLASTHDGAKAKRDRITARRAQKEQLQILGEVQPFGVYRRMQDEAYDSFVAATIVASRDAGMWLRDEHPRERQPKIKMNGDFGVTLLGYQAMRNALVDAIKSDGLNVADLVAELEAIETRDLEVPFSHFEWGGDNRRRLLAKYTLDTAARQELDDTRRQVDQVLDRHGVARTPLEPDHTSVVRIEPPKPVVLKSKADAKLDTRKRRARPTTPVVELTNAQRNTIAEKFGAVFIRKGIGAVSLMGGPLILGTSYSTPIEKPKLDVRIDFSNDL